MVLSSDPHIMTAARIFGLQPSEVTSQMRRLAKLVNFGAYYSLPPDILQSTFNIKRYDYSNGKTKGTSF
jgi:DNA polymerase-1